MSTRTRGFTLVELLVVIAIIGVLVALLLPAVQMARESARRTQCSNNLKQISVGLYGFHDSYGHLPPGAIDTSTTSNARRKLNIPGSTIHAWGIFVYPYIEQKNLSDYYKWDKNWYDAENKSVRETYVATFICPSSPRPKRLDNSTTSGVAWTAAASDYGICNGTNVALFPLGLIDAGTNRKPQGVMRVNELQKFSDVTDGLSNTYWVAEAAGRPQSYRAKGMRNGTARAAGSSALDRDNEYIIHGFNAAGSANPGPCAMNCTNSDEMYSFHPGGVQVMFGDGSVRYLSNQVPMRIVAAWVTREGKEQVSE
jgi:prepilin-type N-terminal cleavage/methylation domain-containing protein/prepilin-type processing-associated H-X9-DG protein